LEKKIIKIYLMKKPVRLALYFKIVCMKLYVLGSGSFKFLDEIKFKQV